MNPSVEIRIGDVFGESNYDVGIARLLIVSRQAAVLRGLLKDTYDATEGLSERSMVLFTYYIAVIKELADAFDHLRALGIVARIVGLRNSPPDLRDAAQSALKHLDEKNPDSFYSTFLKRVRDSAGFHVAISDVRRSLATLADFRVPATKVIGDKQMVVAVPFATAALAVIAVKDSTGISRSMEIANKLHTAIEEVAHDLFLLNVSIAAETEQGHKVHDSK